MSFTAPRAALVIVAMGATIISFAAVLVRWSALGPTAIAVWRMVFAAVALGVLAWREHAGPGARERPPASRAAWGWAALAGLFFTGDLYLWHKGIVRVGAGMATLLVNTHVLWVGAIAAVALGERLTRRLSMAALIAISGVTLLGWRSAAGGAVEALGVAASLLAAVAYAGYYIVLRESRRCANPFPPVTNLFVAALVTTTLLAMVSWAEGESLALPRVAEAAKAACLGVVIHVGGWLLIMRGMPHVPAASGALVLLLQPVLATVWGVLLFREPFGLVELSGGAITLTAIWLASTKSA